MRTSETDTFDYCTTEFDRSPEAVDRFASAKSAEPGALSFEVWQALTAPGDVFRHPREVLLHPRLSSGDKRAILASWASDTHAMEADPSLRCLNGTDAEPVPLDAVLSALAELDGSTSTDPPFKATVEPFSRRRAHRISARYQVYLNRRDDDDDDPPPCPSTLMPWPPWPAPSTEAIAVCA